MTSHEEKRRWLRNKPRKITVSGLSAFIRAYRREEKANRLQESNENRSETRLEVWTLLFVILTTAGIFYQAYLFRGQLSEMKSSGEQTAQLIENNAKLAIAAGKQAEAAEKQASAMSEYAKATRDAFAASQRAWVGPRNVRSDKSPTLHEPFEVTIEYQNSGRDPATETIKDVDIFADIDDGDAKATRRVNDFISACKIMWKPQLANVVYPNSGLGVGYNANTVLKGEDVDEETVAGNKNIYVSGCFVYKTFGNIHRSWFCYYFKNGQTKPSNWSICQTGNDAD